MKVEDVVRQYVTGDARVMQLATVSGNQPWICTVYYVADDELNLYWLSLPTRRHSQEIKEHPKVAAAIAIKHDKPVIGIQVEGDAEEVADTKTVAGIMKKYVAKYEAGQGFYDNFMAGKNQHKLYRIRPRLFVLFDEENFPENGRQEWRPQQSH
jgi:uncharacterized protein YhbP (UPF0306 family)